jgi:hypothetical protein
VRHTSLILAGLALLGSGLLAGSGCAAPPPPSFEARAYESPTGGYTVTVPAGWRVLQGEVRSPSGTLITVKVLSLENADQSFVNGLPASITPQLEAWARYFFQVVGEPTQTVTSLGGVSALEVVYPIRIRPSDPQGHVAFWVAQHDVNLYVIRVASPAGVAPGDAQGVEAFLASWQFVGVASRGSSGEAPPGSFVLDVPPGRQPEQTPLLTVLPSGTPGA